jgi:cell division transport system permease protein
VHTFIYIVRILKTGFRNFFRNGWLSVAATTVMVITLFTISIFTILNIGINAATQSIEEKIDIQAYLADSATPEQVGELRETLENLPEVEQVQYVSKADALKIYREQNKDNPSIANLPDEDLQAALPASVRVKAKDAKRLDPIKRVFEDEDFKPIIENLSTEGEKGETISRLVRITTFIKTAGLILSAVFIATSLLVIFNTIRIAIFTRREEIEIMKLVGATTNFIRWPFIIEGATYGTIATAISFGIQYLAISLGAPAISRYLKLGDGGELFGYFQDNIPLVIALQLLVGVVIGVVSSFVAIRRHLRIATLG